MLLIALEKFFEKSFGTQTIGSSVQLQSSHKAIEKQMSGAARFGQLSGPMDFLRTSINTQRHT
jgi:hypothetical protein